MTQEKQAEAAVEVAQATPEKPKEPTLEELQGTLKTLTGQLEEAQKTSKSHQEYGRKTREELAKPRGIDRKLTRFEQRLEVATDMRADLLDKNEDKIIVSKENGKFIYSALYARVSDETLWKIGFGFLNLKIPRDIQEVLKDNGNNIHVFYVIADGYNAIRKGIREVIKKENPKIITWHNPEMNKFNIFKVKLKEKALC